MARGDTILRFENVDFGFTLNRLLLEEANFSVRDGMKVTIVGQNGAGKSTIFKLIMKELSPKNGKVHTTQGAHIAIAKQTMPSEDRDMPLGAFFRKYSRSDAHNIDREIYDMLALINLLPAATTATKDEAFTQFLDRTIASFSGGQQARLLLGSALIQHPDILLLDEPTNNLDADGIWNLTQFLTTYDRTVIVISHDANFLNAFTDGILYLDIFTRKVEQFLGNYHDAVEQIERRIEAQNRENARLEKEILANKEQANVFAHKWGKLRAVAKKMVEKAEELESLKGDVRREDKTIRPFRIPNQEGIGGQILVLSEVKVIRNHSPEVKEVNISLGKNRHLLLSWPNGIGKSTLLESIAHGTCRGMKLWEGVKIWYYRQDFTTLDFHQTAYESLMESVDTWVKEQELRSLAAGFLITGEVMKTRIGDMSEGQKWLLMFCKLVLEKPWLLILDEPTNHINFRHLPIIAEALDTYEGTMVLVSHMEEFIWQVRIDEYLELE